MILGKSPISVMRGGRIGIIRRIDRDPLARACDLKDGIGKISPARCQMGNGRGVGRGEGNGKLSGSSGQELDIR